MAVCRQERTRFRPTGQRPRFVMATGNCLRGPDGKRVELYNIVSDRGEATNLAGERTEIAGRLKAQLDAWQAELPK